MRSIRGGLGEGVGSMRGGHFRRSSEGPYKVFRKSLESPVLRKVEKTIGFIVFFVQQY